MKTSSVLSFPTEEKEKWKRKEEETLGGKINGIIGTTVARTISRSKEFEAISGNGFQAIQPIIYKMNKSDETNKQKSDMMIQMKNTNNFEWGGNQWNHGRRREEINGSAVREDQKRRREEEEKSDHNHNDKRAVMNKKRNSIKQIHQ